MFSRKAGSKFRHSADHIVGKFIRNPPHPTVKERVFNGAVKDTVHIFLSERAVSRVERIGNKCGADYGNITRKVSVERAVNTTCRN